MSAAPTHAIWSRTLAFISEASEAYRRWRQGEVIQNTNMRKYYCNFSLSRRRAGAGKHTVPKKTYRVDFFKPTHHFGEAICPTLLTETRHAPTSRRWYLLTRLYSMLAQRQSGPLHHSRALIELLDRKLYLLLYLFSRCRNLSDHEVESINVQSIPL